MVSLSWVTCPFWRKVVYFHGRPAHIYSFWSISKGDQPTHTYAGLFSQMTCPHILTLIYFQGRLANAHSHWSIFTGNLPFWLVNLRSHLAISFNQNQNWGIAQSTWNPIWQFLLTKAKLCVWLGYPEILSGDLL